MGKNISKNPEMTKRLIEELWSKADNSQKNKVVTIANVKDTKAVGYTRKTGRISENMAKAFSEVFNVPFLKIIASEQLEIPSDIDAVIMLKALFAINTLKCEDSIEKRVDSIKVKIYENFADLIK